MGCLFGIWEIGLSADRTASGIVSGGGQDTGVRGDNIIITMRIPAASPDFSNYPVATIDDETITVEEFRRNFEPSSEDNAVTIEEFSKQSIDLLERMVNIRLILKEARNIGLHELPEIKNILKVNSNKILRTLLEEKLVRDIKPGREMVEELYKKAVAEWKIKSILVENENIATKMKKEIKAGKEFDVVIANAISDGVARGGGQGAYTKGKDLLPKIADVVSNMTPGSISPVIPVDNGFVILKVEDVRYPDNPEAMEWARTQLLKQEKYRFLKKYNLQLINKYVKVNKKIYKGIDFEAKKPGFAKLLTDKRVVATVKGGKSITVGELADEVRQRFQHGIERAVESKKANSQKEPVMALIINKRVFFQEAQNQGLDKTKEYHLRYQEFEDSLLFDVFLKKVIVPDIRVSDEESRNYYDNNIGNYTYPEMIRIKSLAFSNRKDTEKAIISLREGTEFQWIRENAEGVLGKDAEGSVLFDDTLLTVKNLPADIQKSVSGAKAGENRLYADANGTYYYVLHISQVVPSRPKPFPEIREEITGKVFVEKVNKAIQEWARKLKEAYDVKIYAIDFKRI
jgi:parvulin-like peptidyl-prolyl isomerase